ncbi:MAG: hypothetical protein P8J37_01530 [Fuerstiella sp.]|nr:hypothetical protein [Fuerstiella sp.]
MAESIESGFVFRFMGLSIDTRTLMIGNASGRHDNPTRGPAWSSRDVV